MKDEARPGHKGNGLSAPPFVTIAIPTYNRALLLKTCIESILSQTYEDFELLVSDNHSTDNTTEVLNEIIDRRFRCIRHEENIGLIRNWNACLKHARGEYIVFVSDDDLIANHFLQHCVSLINLEPAIPIVVALSDIFIIGPNRNFSAIPNGKLHTGVWEGVQILTEFLKGRVHTNICTILFRTDALRAIDGFSPAFTCASDIAVSLRLLLLGRAGFVNETCGTHSIHDDSATSRLTVSMRIRDDKKVAELISRTAQLRIDDWKECRRIDLQSRRWVARNAIRSFGDVRREGGSLVSVIGLMWQWRWDLMALNANEILGLAKPIGRIILPYQIIGGLVRLKALAKKSRA